MSIPRYGISHAAMILRLGIDRLDEGTGENEKIAASAAIATLAALFNGDTAKGSPSRLAGMTPREIYELEYEERGGETESPVAVRCDQCAACMIQGVFCHETGCPNTNSRYDAESGEWIKRRKCGCSVDADDLCCNAQDEDDEVETCSKCGASLDDGEGYDGMCGGCADSDEEEHEDTDSLEDRGLTLGSFGS